MSLNLHLDFRKGGFPSRRGFCFDNVSKDQRLRSYNTEVIHLTALTN